ncbi:MAG: carboxypeptidase-like regulatory domain-containing protein [Gammaproteobacteria bacterium]|nr:carboxypeptidase-like regulatory domain-containing protein [Gammaproteobacteria bacterium]
MNFRRSQSTRRLYLSIVTLGIWLVSPFAVLADIANGVSWLATQPNANGSFGSTSATLAAPVQTTAEVLRAYLVLGQQTQVPFNPALGFLNADPEANAEFTARKIVVNVRTGNDVTALINTLITYQNQDGGFGHQVGYASSVLDTAFALEALASANYTSGAIVAGAAGYLLNHQQANGGWGDGENAAAVYLTAQSMRALWSYRQTYLGVSAALTGAQNFLLSQRSSAGLWSEHFETATALIAMLPYVGDLALIENSVAALSAAQQANGSWNDDSYTTALALQALYAYQLRRGGVSPDQTGALSGYVVRAGSQEPIAGAVVMLAERTGVSVLTNNDGYFVIQSLPAGTYTLIASKTGYTSASVTGSTQGGQVSVAGNLVLGVSGDAGLVSGKIFDALDLTALSGSSVTLSGTTTYTATANTSGTFSLNTVTPGSYTVSISKNGYESISGAATVVGGQTLILNQGLVKAGGFQDNTPGTISGAVINANTGAPIAGAVFDLGGGLSGSSDANGQFNIHSVPRANYTGSLSAAGFVTQSYSLSFPAGALGNLGTLSLYPSSSSTAPTTLTLNGLVVDGVTRLPIAGATVNLLETSATATTGANGRFLFDGITLKSFTLVTSASNYQTSTLGMQVAAFGQAEITVALAPPGTGAALTTLSGTVRDAQTSAAVAGARVRIEGTNFTALADASGNYTLSGIDSLQFTVSVTAVGYAQAASPVTIAAHGNYTLNPVLQPVAATGFQVISVRANQTQSPANATALFTAEIANLLATSTSALVIGEVLDVNGASVATLTAYAEGTTIPTSQFTFAPNETKTLTIPWSTAQFAPGVYTIVVRAVQPGSINAARPRGEILAEGNGYATLVASNGISGALAINPPLTQAGATTPVTLTALVRNNGNVPLAAGDYELTVTNSSGAALYRAQTTGAAIEVGVNAVIDFGSWVPTAAGNLNVRVHALAGAVPGEITGILYVGDKASGTFSVNKTVVAEGTQTVRGKITMQGVDVRSGSSTDPLFVLVKEAVKRGGQYTAPAAINWHTTNRCLGCHIQTQSEFGLASSLDKAEVDRGAATFLYNAIASSLQADGALRISHPEYAKAQTYLGIWALGAWPNKEESFRSSYKAAKYLYDRRVQSGNTMRWSTDHATGWWYSDVSNTALALSGFADLVAARAALDMNNVKDFALGPAAPLGAGTNPLDIETGPDGALYVVKYSSGMVVRYDPNTGLTSTVASGLPAASYGLAFSADGTMYVSGSGFLRRINSDGTSTVVMTVGSVLTDVETGPDGWLYIADYNGNSIRRYLPATGQSEVFVSGGLLRNPYGLSFDANGNLLVANYNGFNLLKIAPDKTVSIFADGLAFRPLWLTVAADATIYVSTEAPDGVTRVRSNGVAERLFSASTLRGLVSVGAHVYVGNQSTNNLHEINTLAMDTAFLADFQNAIAGGAQYFLSNYQDNTSDNIIQAMRMIGLAYAREALTDPALLTQINTAIAYENNLLRTRQRADGGWGRSVGNTSDPLVSAMVGIALDYTNPSPDDQQIRKIIQYLLNTQAADGSWANINNGLTTRLAATSFVMAYLPKALERLGGIDVDLHVDVPANVQLANPSIVPTSTLPGTSGGAEYIWKLLGVTNNGRTVEFDLTLLNMQLNESRAVATRADLEFDNSFTAEKVQVPLQIPIVRAAAGMSLGVSTDKQGYLANELVTIAAPVSNSGVAPASGQVVLAIRAPGSLVNLIELAPIAVDNLAVGSTVPLTASWNTGATFAGSYEVYARLLDTQGRLAAEATAPFNINAPAVANATATLVTTDKPLYDAWDSVQINGRVQNIAPNKLLPPTRVELTVRSPAGAVLFFEARSLGELVPLSLRDLPYTLLLADAVGGDYSVELVLKDAFTRSVLNTSATTFQVQRRDIQALSGSVTVTTPTVYQGDANLCTETAKNISGSALSGVQLIHQLINVDTGSVVNELTETVDLPAGGIVHSYFRNIDTRGLALGGYSCVINANVNGATKVLAFGGFQVMPPPIRIDANLTIGAKGRLLVLLDNGRRGDDPSYGLQCSCDGVKQLSLATSFSTPLSNNATVTARVTGVNGAFVDNESANLAGFAGALNLNAGSNGADLVLSRFTAQGIELTLQPTSGAAKLGNEFSVEIVVQDGATLKLTSGTIRTDCRTPVVLGQVFGALTLSGLDVVPSANAASYRDTDPYGPASAPGLKAQRAFLEKLLKAKGWSYTITDTAEDFTRQFHSGNYSVYALFAEQEKLDEQTQKELREATFRGEGLVMAGIHDARNQKLLEALGVKLIGSVRANGVDLTGLGLSGHIDLIVGDKALRMKRVRAETAGIYTVSAPQMRTDNDDCHDEGARYEASANNSRSSSDNDDDECAGHPERYLDAVVVNAYGQGRSAFTGFDLLITATRDGQNSLAGALLAKALEYVHPTEFSRSPGAVVPLTLTLINRGIATPATATINLPSGAKIIDPGTGTAGVNALVFNVNLGVGAQQQLTFWVKLPQPAGAATFQGVVTVASLAQPAAVVFYNVNVVQPESLTSIDDRLVQLINSNSPNSSALRRAENEVAKALKNFFPQMAVPNLLKATDALLGIDDPTVMDIRVALDVWIRWAGQYAF